MSAVQHVWWCTNGVIDVSCEIDRIIISYLGSSACRSVPIKRAKRFNPTHTISKETVQLILLEARTSYKEAEDVSQYVLSSWACFNLQTEWFIILLSLMLCLCRCAIPNCQQHSTNRVCIFPKSAVRRVDNQVWKRHSCKLFCSGSGENSKFACCIHACACSYLHTCMYLHVERCRYAHQK